MNKFSVVIPFRDRHEHISVLVPHLREYATTNRIDMEIIVVEQNDMMPLRRGALRNEGVRVANNNIIVLHDVDYLPDFDVPYWTENADVYRPVKRVEFVQMDGTSRNESDVPAGYRKFKEQTDDNFFGGVLCITKDKFIQINGYNPMFEGWGLEDDDFRERVRGNRLRVISGNGAFKALPHPDSFKNDELFRRNQLLFSQREILKQVGMNFASLSSKLNNHKAMKYGVDVWLECTGWNVTMPSQEVTSENTSRDPGILFLSEKYSVPNTTVVDVETNVVKLTQTEITNLDAFSLTNVSLIKIDAECHESYVLDKARNTIKLNRPVILFELTTPQLLEYPDNFVATLLTEMNYNIYQISDMSNYVALPKEKDDNVQGE